MPLWLPSLRMERRQERGKAKEKQSSDRQDETNREAPKITVFSATQDGELAENTAA